MPLPRPDKQYSSSEILAGRPLLNASGKPKAPYRTGQFVSLGAWSRSACPL